MGDRTAAKNAQSRRARGEASLYQPGDIVEIDGLAFGESIDSMKNVVSSFEGAFFPGRVVSRTAKWVTVTNIEKGEHHAQEAGDVPLRFLRPYSPSKTFSTWRDVHVGLIVEVKHDPLLDVWWVGAVVRRTKVSATVVYIWTNGTEPAYEVSRLCRIRPAYAWDRGRAAFVAYLQGRSAKKRANGAAVHECLAHYWETHGHGVARPEPFDAGPPGPASALTQPPRRPREAAGGATAREAQATEPARPREAVGGATAREAQATERARPREAVGGATAREAPTPAGTAARGRDAAAVPAAAAGAQHGLARLAGASAPEHATEFRAATGVDTAPRCIDAAEAGGGTSASSQTQSVTPRERGVAEELRDVHGNARAAHPGRRAAEDERILCATNNKVQIAMDSTDGAAERATEAPRSSGASGDCASADGRPSVKRRRRLEPGDGPGALLPTRPHGAPMRLELRPERRSLAAAAGPPLQPHAVQPPPAQGAAEATEVSLADRICALAALCDEDLPQSPMAQSAGAPDGTAAAAAAATSTRVVGLMASRAPEAAGPGPPGCGGGGKAEERWGAAGAARWSGTAEPSGVASSPCSLHRV